MLIEKNKSTPHLFNVSLKLILENEHGEVLALKNPERSVISKFYDFPGGRINSNELRTSLEEVIRREVREEIGEDVQFKVDMNPSGIGRHLYFSKKLKREVCVMMIFFRAKYLGGDIRISEEHVGYKWLSLNPDNISEYFTSGFAEGVSTYLQEKTKL